MYFFKQTVFKVVLLLVLVLSAFSGNIAQADGQPPTPATSQFVAINTIGSLPVVVLNLTMSPISLSVSTTSSFYNNGASAFPLAAGLPGVYFAGSPAFNNITTPNNSTLPSLNTPVTGVSANKGPNVIDSISFSNSYDWMSLFTLFPSWTTPVTISKQQYVSLNDFGNNAPYGAAAGNYNVVSGYPSGDGGVANKSATNAAALNAAQATTTTINLALQFPPYPDYQIKISSLGAGTSGNVAAPNNFSLLNAMHIALNIVTDITTLASGDPLGIADYAAGIPATIEGIVSSASTNTNVSTNTQYPAQSKGIQVSASMPTIPLPSTMGIYIPGPNPLSLTSGDSQSLMYKTRAVAYGQPLPLTMQNAVFITTFRQAPGNTGSLERNSTDTLFVTVLNEGVYASKQVQQYINSNNSSQMTGAEKYKPTKEQAQDTLKILAILTALSKDRPQDAQTIIDMFGSEGKYDSLKNDPNAMKNFNIELKAILERYKKAVPDVERYLANLARK